MTCLEDIAGITGANSLRNKFVKDTKQYFRVLKICSTEHSQIQQVRS